MTQVIVVREVSDGSFSLDTVHTDDPLDAMHTIRDDPHRSGSAGMLHAFTIESHDGTPVFTPVGILEPVVDA